MTAMLITLPSWAVLSEDNIDRTLIMLSEDMKVLETNIQRDLKRFEDRQRVFCNNIDSLSEVCDEMGIVLYSQDERYLYGSLQATQSMKYVIDQIRLQTEPLTLLEQELSDIETRYGELSHFLKSLECRNFSPEARLALKNSQTIADSLQKRIQTYMSQLNRDKIAYNLLSGKADKLERYNNMTEANLQKRIFMTGNETFGEILAHFHRRCMEFVDDLEWRFLTGQSNTDDWNSQEDRLYHYLDLNNWIALIVAGCCFLLTRFKRFYPKWMLGKRLYYSIIFGLAVLVTGLLVIRLIVGSGHQFQIILLIETELYMLALLIVVSVTLRLNRKNIGRALLSYLPIFALTFLLLAYREDLVPLSTVTFSAPFLFMTALAFQIAVVWTGYKKLDITDRNMAYANLIVLAISFAMICYGYTILATMIYLLWIGIETGIMLIALARTFISRKQISGNSVIGLSLLHLVYPLAFPAIILLSFIWVAHIYNLTLWLNELMRTPFLDMPDKIGVISAAKLLAIFTLGVIVNYVITIIRSLLRRNPKYRQGQVAVWISVGNIMAWLIYIVTVMIILDINKAGLIAAVGGASVGIGFALKDTFENFFSGMSLMTGRLRPGDILQYEGERGKVLNIGIISTTMETEDGPIMTMPNRQLFEKNFKNMTRNHQVELRHITFDISADNDPKSVRNLILDCFRDIDGVDNSRKHVVIMRNFGSGVMRVELKVWIDSEKYLATEPAVREAVFEAFRTNGIQKASFIEQIDAKGSASIMENNRTIL